jgi:hypothetical protein
MLPDGSGGGGAINELSVFRDLTKNSGVLSDKKLEIAQT